MTQDSESNSTVPQPSAPNSVSSLADRLKAKAAAEASVIQSATQSELALHQQHLRDLSQHALSTTRDVIESQVVETTGLMKSTGKQIAGDLTNVRKNLSKHGDQMLDAARATSETVTQELETVAASLKTTQSRFLEASAATANAVDQQQRELRSAIQSQTQQIMWLMKVPILTVLICCLLLCGAVWGWTAYRVSQAEISEAQADHRLKELQSQIDQLTARFCATPAGKKNCISPKK